MYQSFCRRWRRNQLLSIFSQEAHHTLFPFPHNQRDSLTFCLTTNFFQDHRGVYVEIASQQHQIFQMYVPLLVVEHLVTTTYVVLRTSRVTAKASQRRAPADVSFRINTNSFETNNTNSRPPTHTLSFQSLLLPYQIALFIQTR